ncbi:MAG: tRNA adenosine(34) deaminase TadA [Gammaproteobacteria bacterium]|nr:tRNA adenosine(34) deaminase TadA [Gammaproteobacteria bacterium]
MEEAYALALQAAHAGEVPVGAVIYQGDRRIGQGSNQPIAAADCTAHAEIIALRAACHHTANYRLPNTTLYVTLEPCAMCAGAILQARIQRLVFATPDPRSGAAGSRFQLLQCDALNHRCEISSGVLAEPCAALLRDFFRRKRKNFTPV